MGGGVRLIVDSWMDGGRKKEELKVINDTLAESAGCSSSAPKEGDNSGC